MDCCVTRMSKAEKVSEQLNVLLKIIQMTMLIDRPLGRREKQEKAIFSLSIIKTVFLTREE